MDGTFNLGDGIIDGSLYFIDTLRELGKDFLFLTNNSSKHQTCGQHEKRADENNQTDIKTRPRVIGSFHFGWAVDEHSTLNLRIKLLKIRDG